MCLTLSLSDRDRGSEQKLGLVSPYLPILCSLSSSSSLVQLSLNCTDFVFIRNYCSIEMLMSKIDFSLSLSCFEFSVFCRLQIFSLFVVCRQFNVVRSCSSYPMFTCIFLFVRHLSIKMTMMAMPSNGTTGNETKNKLNQRIDLCVCDRQSTYLEF